MGICTRQQSPCLLIEGVLTFEIEKETGEILKCRDRLYNQLTITHGISPVETSNDDPDH
jgi:hypothetical protein